MIPGIDEIKNLAVKYSKKELAHMAQLGLVDPQKAVMAGMMRDRISKEDMQPPTTTVAQDILGAPSAPQAPAGMAALPQAPAPQAPSAGIEALPAGEVGNYAGGGIVAFGEGGDVPSYAGESRWGSLVGGWGAPAPMSAETQQTFGLMQGAADRDAAEREQRRAAYAQRLDGIRQKMASGMPLNAEEQTLARANNITATTPAVNESAAETARLVRQNNSITNPFADKKSAPAPDQKLPPIAAPAPAPKTPKAPAAGGAPTSGFKFPDIAGYKTDIPVESVPVPESKNLQQLGDESSAEMQRRGIDPDMYDKMVAAIEEKKGEAATEKDRAIGEAIMQAGFKLMGARKGQEFAALSEGAQEGLKSFQATMKEVKARQDKLDERIDAYRVAKDQAARTGLKSDIERMDRLQEQVQKAKEANTKAKNDAALHAAQFATTRYGAEVGALATAYHADVAAAATRYSADAHAAVQGAYTAAIRQGQLDERRARTLIEAADHFIKNNADKPGYLNKPQLLQQDAMDYAAAMERRFMSGQGGGAATPTSPAGNRPSLSTFQK